MKKRFRFLELALAIGLAIALVCGARADLRQAELSQKMMRLHVLANSDSDTDQALKLRVRDRVIAYSEKLLADAPDIDSAKERITAHLPQIEACARAEIDRSGFSYPVRAELAEMYFPTRDYASFSLPAGQYDAFRVVIGAGKGHNWWCVMFPPLCVTAAEAEVTKSAEDAGLTDEEIALIEDGKTAYRYEFKIMELIGTLKHVLTRK